MKRTSALSVLVGCFALALIFLPAAAQAGRCINVCNSTASCDLGCNAGTAGYPDWITCGDWGTCAGSEPPPPTCTSNWVTTTTAIGGFAVQSFFPNGCDYYGVSSITRHDTNGCQADQVSCGITFHTFRSDGACCTYYWCGGNTCGY
jgi:hypothetical protein